MARTVSSLENFDNKRIKVTLDYDEVTFLLYKGEAGKLRLKAGDELSDETYRAIIDDILIPRAKKRVLYFMKNSDKTEGEIRRRLKEGLYPDEVIEAVMQFLSRCGFADDERYIEEFAQAKKKRYSRREIEAKLSQKGIKREAYSQPLDELLTSEDEYEAACNAVRAKYPHGVGPDDLSRAYASLARRGFSHDAIRGALQGS